MTTRRTARVNRAIQEAVSTAVLFKVKDPRVKNVTVLRAEATDDLRQAKVYVSVMGDEKRQALTMNGLAAARGFLQSKVADRLQTKQTPILTFVLDQIVKQNAAAQAALSELFPVAGEADEDDDDETDLNAGGTDALNDESLDDLEEESDEFENGRDNDSEDGDLELDLEADDFEEVEDEDFPSEDVGTVNGAGTTDAQVIEQVQEVRVGPRVAAISAAIGEQAGQTVSEMDESKLAEPEKNEDLASR